MLQSPIRGESGYVATKSWNTGKAIRSPFALPRGLRGRIAGQIMLWTNRRQRELLELVRVQPGDHVLEVGYGPGALIRRLRRTPAAQIYGIDPSPEMRALAMSTSGPDHSAGRVVLRLGTAEDTGFSDAEFDLVITVNTVAIWPDLEAGLRELYRVTRPGGRLVIAWHGGTHPSRVARSLALPEAKLAHVQQALDALFSSVTRHELTDLTVFIALH